MEFWNDPDISVHTLPAGVELDKKRPGHSVALFSDYQFTAQNDEYLDPARYQSRGFSVLLDAMWRGARIAWCPYCYADNDAALMRGWIQVLPKKNPAPYTRPALSPPRARLPRPSRRIVGSPPACLLMAGCLVQAHGTLREKAEHLIGLLDHQIVGPRHFPRLSAGMHDKPAVDELVRCVSDQLLITNIWTGEGDLNFPEAYGEELEVLGPLKVGRGYQFSFSYSVKSCDPGRSDRLAIAAANTHVRDCGRNRQVDALRSNQLRLLSVASVLRASMHRDMGMLKGFTVPKSPFGQAALTPLPPWHYARCCWSRVLDGP